MTPSRQAVSGLLIREAPIDWEMYRLDDDDKARVIEPLQLLDKTLDVLTGKGSHEGATLPWYKTQNTVRMKGGKVTVWAGVTHHGKTQVIKQVILHLARCGERSCIASLEELPEETFADMARMGLPNVDQIDRDWLDVFAGWCGGKIWLYDQQGMISTDRVLALMAYCAKEKRCTHFIIDSLMRIGVTSDDYEQQRVFFNRVTNYAKHLNLHVHIVCHMRKQQDELSVGNIFDVRGGASIVEQADSVFIVWRDKREDRLADEPSGLLVVDKQRGRPNWLGKIKLWHDERTGQFLGDRFDRPQQYMSSTPQTGRDGDRHD
jgi:twinkle protein